MSEIKLSADSGGGSVSLKGPASTTGNAAMNFVLPVADGSAGQLLKTDGSKNLGWATDSSGKILQVQQCVLRDVSSSSTKESWIDIVGNDQNNSGSILCVETTPATIIILHSI